MIHSGMKVRDMANKSGVILLHEIPDYLNPKMLPLGTITKTDSNMGIDAEWTKIVFHIYIEGNYRSELVNLPRIFWAKKSWTLKELHLNFFDYFKDILRRWFKDIAERGNSERCT